MGDLSVDAVDTSYYSEDLHLDDEKSESFSVLASKDFEILQNFIQKKLAQLAPAPSPPSESRFQFTEKKESLRNLIDSHSLPSIVKGTCHQWLFNVEKQMRTFDFQGGTDLDQKKKSLFDTVQTSIGKLLFLGERYPKEIEMLLIKTTSAFTAIDNRFAQEIKAFQESLQTQADIQDPNLARNARIATELAQMLLNEKGQINFALIPSLNFVLSSLET